MKIIFLDIWLYFVVFSYTVLYYTYLSPFYHYAYMIEATYIASYYTSLSLSVLSLTHTHTHKYKYSIIHLTINECWVQLIIIYNLVVTSLT